jgi:uncharacterized protein GlcG (DUF336 family)
VKSRTLLLLPLVSLAALASTGVLLAGPPPAPPRPAHRATETASNTKATRTPAVPLAGPSRSSESATGNVTQKRGLTLDGAGRAIAAAVAKARSLKTTGVIAIVDEGGNLMALERLDGTFTAGANISIGKARTAVLFNKPTRVFEEIIKSGRTPMVALDDFTPLQGSVPIVVGGSTVGGIGVSGAASAAQDEELAIAGATALASSGADTAAYTPATVAPPAPASVAFFSHAAVDTAFAKGVPLLENSVLKVHASRREAAGLAEVHSVDADIAYVQAGTATLVTGGTLVNPRTVEANEIRGDAIIGGETRELAKGDVVVIPKGVPHWFKRVTSPFTYFVVKAH